MKRVDSGELRAKFVQKEMADCEKYRVNMESANFGECICGRPKAEHTSAALKAAEATRKTEDEAAMLERMTGKEKVTCMEYRINMDPGAPFAAFAHASAGAAKKFVLNGVLSALVPFFEKYYPALSGSPAAAAEASRPGLARAPTRRGLTRASSDVGLDVASAVHTRAHGLAAAVLALCIASHEQANRIRCCGSIALASAGQIPKARLSKSSA